MTNFKAIVQSAIERDPDLRSALLALSEHPEELKEVLGAYPDSNLEAGMKLLEKEVSQSNEIFLKVVAIVAEKLGIEDQTSITLESNLQDDLGTDSLDLFEIIIDIDKTFNLGDGIPDEDVPNLKTVSALVTYIKEYSQQEAK